jgi:putative ABC transport system permease protein
LTVSGIGIANVMLASISHATRDIGVRMAIGAKSYHIILHYLIEAMIVTFAGGIIGIILSWVIVTILKNIPIHSQFFTSLGSPQPILSWSVILTSILVLGLIGFLAGFFPANKAAKIDPLEALRHE